MFPSAQKHVRVWVRRDGAFRLSLNSVYLLQAVSCRSIKDREVRLAAQRFCSSCFLAPRNSLPPPDSWVTAVLQSQGLCRAHPHPLLSSTLCPQSLDLQNWKEGGTGNRSPRRSVVTLCLL